MRQANRPSPTRDRYLLDPKSWRLRERVVDRRFERGVMVGASLPNKSITSVLSFVPFTKSNR
ncbi:MULTISPECIES: hypothetical protein [unclassified Microcoleus]|uniref:hypothetical protein n=1 Tax=unclassified Microcoleus TaxID=2642155 RepID=UPI001D8B573C|nr:MULTISPECIES: hypothetical protein [unclassified Microcoleus]MCC3600086.1 hypothetical protein [Microcoleus sp. PH2017_26_ELK_O_A]MCC3625058.1 hypothetical protein [Microcoleus sp. PH2017_36_ELK_O_B]